MNPLLKVLEQTSLKRRLLPSYRGPCSIGIVTHPAHAEALAVKVRLPPDSQVEVAPRLEVDGHQVEVIVTHDYRPVRALASH